MNPVRAATKGLSYSTNFLCTPFLGGPIVLFTPGEVAADGAFGVVSPVNSEAHLPRLHDLHYGFHHHWRDCATASGCGRYDRT